MTTVPVLLKALLLGIVEGLTEFLPISSTGHLIIAGTVLDFPAAQRATFEIFIQLGATMAVFWHFRADLLRLGRDALHDTAARVFMFKVAAAFVPAALFGLLLGDFIEQHLFRVSTVAAALVAGGVFILFVERKRGQPAVREVEETRWRDAVWVGIAQIASLFPGVSRAGATIIGGMLAGMSRNAATRFSFYLSMPTLAAASLYSLLKSLPELSAADTAPFAAGLVSAFVSALVVIRVFLAYVHSHDFRLFGYYRIVLGALLLLAHD